MIFFYQVVTRGDPWMPSLAMLKKIFLFFLYIFVFYHVITWRGRMGGLVRTQYVRITNIWQYTIPGTFKGPPYIYIYIHTYTHIHTYGSIQIRARAKTVRYALQGSSSQIAAGSTRLFCYRSSGTFYYRSSWKVIY